MCTCTCETFSNNICCTAKGSDGILGKVGDQVSRDKFTFSIIALDLCHAVSTYSESKSVGRLVLYTYLITMLSGYKDSSYKPN